ncbi:hypothetical protein [Peptoniphilus vaginalis]|uniref:hypothetical protein n=1 Tax=Peptoniphilus vaginalis TaxID=1756987 RepID=UPI0010731189|nr:hypothetical protein [Peptoniphilus vaginalis]
MFFYVLVDLDDFINFWDLKSIHNFIKFYNFINFYGFIIVHNFISIHDFINFYKSIRISDFTSSYNLITPCELIKFTKKSALRQINFHYEVQLIYHIESLPALDI